MFGVRTFFRHISVRRRAKPTEEEKTKHKALHVDVPRSRCGLASVQQNCGRKKGTDKKLWADSELSALTVAPLSLYDK